MWALFRAFIVSPTFVVIVWHLLPKMRVPVPVLPQNTTAVVSKKPQKKAPIFGNLTLELHPRPQILFYCGPDGCLPRQGSRWFCPKFSFLRGSCLGMGQRKMRRKNLLHDLECVPWGKEGRNISKAAVVTFVGRACPHALPSTRYQEGFGK